MNEGTVKVLLLEDDVDDYRLVAKRLRQERCYFSIDWAETLQAAIERLSRHSYDIVLADLSVPDSFGLDTVSSLRKRSGRTPIIILTSLDDDTLGSDILTAGAQDYLVKGELGGRAVPRAIHNAIQRQQSLTEINNLLAEVNASRELLAEQTQLLESKNRRLRKLYKTAHRFVDNVSHEFRTPLTVVKDYVTLVRDGLVGDVNDEQRRMLDIAGVRADELNNMVDDMLDISKLESGLLGAWRRNCHVSDIIHSVRPVLEAKAKVKDIEFHISLDEDLPQVYCDQDKVIRVIINLVTNAMKFCGEPGSVQLWAQQNDSPPEVVVGVTDNGPGIGEERLSEIFKRFKQLETNFKDSGKGFGLGLSIAKELVDLNFGEMHVETELERGSTFSFTLPAARPVEVMRRYLERAARLGHDSTVVSFVSACVHDSVCESASEDLNAFFNYLLRRNDLLFQRDSHCWLYIVPTPRLELNRFVARAGREWQKTNRNRPFGKLPKFEMQVEGTWAIADQHEVILDQFCHLFGKEAVHA